MTQQIMTHAHTIAGILRANLPARDNDITLYAVLLRAVGFDIDKRTAVEMLKAVHAGDLPHFESVRRTRQKLQEENEDLRGKRYEERQKKRRDVKTEMILGTEAARLAQLHNEREEQNQ